MKRTIILNYFCFCGALVVNQFIIKLLLAAAVPTNCVYHPLKFLEEAPPY